MQRQNLKLKISNFKLWFLAFSIQLLVVFGLCGCAVVDLFTPEGPPSYEQVSQSYCRTKLKTSSSADVLAVIHLPEYELLSQSKSVVASLGQKKKGYKTWLNMVAFDENKLTAQRKYLFIVDEKPKALFVEPWASLRFDCEMVLEPEILDEPYSNENARRIATLRQVLKNARKDIDELGQDNKMIAVSGMLINQGLEAILVKLDSSPALATGLNTPAGVEFSHMTCREVGMNITEEDLIKTYAVKDVMDTRPASIAQDLPLHQILEVFSTTDSVYYPVINAQSQIIGVITIADIKEMFANQDVAGWLLACDVAEPVLDKTTPEKPLDEAIERMRQYDLETMPVVDSDDTNKLVGVLDYRKTLRKISAEVLRRRKLTDEMALQTG